MRRKSFFLTLVGLVFLATSSAAQQVASYKKGRNVQIVSQEKLGPKSRKEFRKWRDGPNYFGVLVFSTEEDGSFGSARGLHDFATARKDAMIICRARAKDPASCYEYAYSLPRGYDPKSPDIAIGATAHDAFYGPYKKRQKPNTYSAFAISDGFDWGYSLNRDTAKAAREAAIVQCQAGAAGSKARASDAIRKALKLNTRGKCRVIHTSKR